MGNAEGYENYYHRFSKKEYARRHAKVREAMKAKNLDCLIVFGTSGVGNAVNVRYLSNYADYLHSYIIFPLDKEPTQFMGLYCHLYNAKAISEIEDITWGGNDIAKNVAEKIRQLGLDKKRIGIVGIAKRFSSVPHDHYLVLKERLPQAEFENATSLLEEIRAIPSPEEVEALKEGGQLTDKIMQVMVDAVRPGITEYQLSAEVKFAGEKEGGHVHVFLLGSTPMSNPRMPYPWPFPSRRMIQPGDLILTELSVETMEGYSGQVIRPIALGEPDEEYWRLYNAALRVCQGIPPLLKTGNKPRQFLEVTRTISEAGFTIEAPVIHGRAGTTVPPLIGLPGLELYNSALDEPLKENQSIQIEPNPCTKDLRKGIFLGDMYRVTSKGGESYQHFPMEFIIKKAK